MKRVQLAPGDAPELHERGLGAHGPAIGIAGGHHVVRVGGGDDPGAKRDLRERGRRIVAVSVVALVVAQDDVRNRAVAVDAADQLGALLRMQLDRLPLLSVSLRFAKRIEPGKMNFPMSCSRAAVWMSSCSRSSAPRRLARPRARIGPPQRNAAPSSRRASRASASRCFSRPTCSDASSGGCASPVPPPRSCTSTYVRIKVLEDEQHHGEQGRRRRRRARAERRTPAVSRPAANSDGRAVTSARSRWRTRDLVQDHRRGRDHGEVQQVRAHEHGQDHGGERHPVGVLGIGAEREPERQRAGQRERHEDRGVAERARERAPRDGAVDQRRRGARAPPPAPARAAPWPTRWPGSCRTAASPRISRAAASLPTASTSSSPTSAPARQSAAWLSAIALALRERDAGQRQERHERASR